MLAIEHKKDEVMFCCVSQESIPKMFLFKFRSLADNEVLCHIESLLSCMDDIFTGDAKRGLSYESDSARKTYSNELFMCSLVELTLSKIWLYLAAKRHRLLQYQM